jgi:hypothetical protein
VPAVGHHRALTGDRPAVRTDARSAARPVPGPATSASCRSSVHPPASVGRVGRGAQPRPSGAHHRRSAGSDRLQPRRGERPARVRWARHDGGGLGRTRSARSSRVTRQPERAGLRRPRTTDAGTHHPRRYAFRRLPAQLSRSAGGAGSASRSSPAASSLPAGRRRRRPSRSADVRHSAGSARRTGRRVVVVVADPPSVFRSAVAQRAPLRAPQAVPFSLTTRYLGAACGRDRPGEVDLGAVALRQGAGRSGTDRDQILLRPPNPEE